jgi:hypothetical protein
MPFETLLRCTPDPIGALAEGDYGPLLRALYEDSGLRPPRCAAFLTVDANGSRGRSRLIRGRRRADNR